MTSLLFTLEPERVCIAMDTLCLSIDPDTGERTPRNYCSKLYLLPHLRGVICGTGITSLIASWHNCVQENTVARDITMLDSIAQATLPELVEQLDLPKKPSTTIYHFGFWPAASEYIGLAYRSEHGFERDQLEHGLGVKPPDGIDLTEARELCQENGLPAVFIDVMKRQKALDEARPPAEQLGIGGEVQFLVMTEDGYSITTCHRFDDYESVFSRMLEACKQP